MPNRAESGESRGRHWARRVGRTGARRGAWVWGAMLLSAGACGLAAVPAASASPPAVFARPSQPASQAATQSTGGQASRRASTAPADFPAPPGGWKEGVATGNINRVSMDGLDANRAWFHLAVPPAYRPDKPWPLAIILHGGPGGSPDEIVSFVRAGLSAKGVISIYPRAMGERVLEWNYPEEGAYLLAILRQVARTYRIDPCRVYLVGVSMGGGGAWTQGAVLKDVWAGIAPIAGWYGPNPTPDPNRLRGMPIYCLHGTADAAVPVERSRLAVKAMEAPGHKVRVVTQPADLRDANATMIVREVEGASHNVFLPWDSQGRVELGMLFAWLLTKHRETPADLDAADKALADWGRPFGWRPAA